MLQVKAITKNLAQTMFAGEEQYRSMFADDKLSLRTMKLREAIYYGGYVGRKLVLLIMLLPYKDGHKVHAHINPKYRFSARAFAKLVLTNWHSPMYTRIPECYRGYIRFCKRIGFTVESKHSGEYLKNGVSYGSLNMMWSKGNARYH